VGAPFCFWTTCYPLTLISFLLFLFFPARSASAPFRSNFFLTTYTFSWCSSPYTILSAQPNMPDQLVSVWFGLFSLSLQLDSPFLFFFMTELSRDIASLPHLSDSVTLPYITIEGLALSSMNWHFFSSLTPRPFFVGALIDS